MLYTQITQGAPFEVFFSADDARTATATKDGFAVEGTEFTYALGQVVLYSKIIDVTDGEAVLRRGAFHHIAIADPKTAPYGAAGLAILDKLGIVDALRSKVVTGENITQTLQFVESGSAELGFVALSQVVGKAETQVWHVPEEDYPAIRQNAVLLKAGNYEEAEAVYREDLRRWPENGWSLLGLADAIEAQGRADEAAEARSRFKKAWRWADTKIGSSCLCVTAAR